MNKKGFTVIELIAVLVVLGLVLSITVYSISSIFKNTKDKTEDVFVGTITDALDMYLASNAKSLNGWNKCGTLNKTHNSNVSVYMREIDFMAVIDSDYAPITEEELVNPANENVSCNKDAKVIIYKDDDNVYYYSFEKVDFGCFLNNKKISNLPKSNWQVGSSC